MADSLVFILAGIGLAFLIFAAVFCYCYCYESSDVVVVEGPGTEVVDVIPSHEEVVVVEY